MNHRGTIERVGWIAIAIVVAAGFFLTALSDDVYRETSPTHVATRLFGGLANQVSNPYGISLHIVLRKIYSVVAFAIVGWTAERALPASTRPQLRMTILVAVYSAAIEYCQWRDGSAEGPGWETFDTLCGALGGYLAITIDAFVRRRIARRRVD